MPFAIPAHKQVFADSMPGQVEIRERKPAGDEAIALADYALDISGFPPISGIVEAANMNDRERLSRLIAQFNENRELMNQRGW